MEIKDVSLASSKLKPIYPYFAKTKAGGNMAFEDSRNIGQLCLIHLFGAFMIDPGRYSRGDSWTWNQEDRGEKEANFEPLPLGSIVTLENT